MKIEGRNQVTEAIKSGKTINKIYVDKNFATRKDEIISLAKQNRVRIEFLPKKAMDEISVTNHHQGYIAETIDFEYCNVEDILKVANDRAEAPFVVL